MFHIGKTRKIIIPKNKDVLSADKSVQAMVMMWDKNLLLLEVDSRLALKIKENDYVVADYRPIAPNSPHRRMKIVKILRGELGKSIFREFTNEYESRKSKTEPANTPVQPAVQYIR